MVLFILGALELIGALSFAKPCPHDTALKSALAIAGGITALISLVGLFKPNLVCACLSFLGGAFMLAAPGTVLKLCEMPAMRCRAYTRPTSLVLGAIIMALAACHAALLIRDGRRERRA